MTTGTTTETTSEMTTETTTDRARAGRADITRGVLIATAMLTIAFGLQRATPAYLAPDSARRLVGVILGLVVVAYANVVPKALAPLRTMRCEPAAEQATRRFVGRSLVIGGLGYAVAWAAAPLAHASLLAGACLGIACVLVVLRLTRGPSPRARR